ncbi:MAG: endopeptidase La [Oscillochloridaceae bacterium umkhey_bin13]
MREETPVLFHFPAAGTASALSDSHPAERDLIVLPLGDTVLFPHMLASLFLADEGAVAAAECAWAGDRRILGLARREPAFGPATLDDLFGVGSEAELQRLRRMPDGTISVVLLGQRRMRVVTPLSNEPPLRARAKALSPAHEHSLAIEAMTRAVLTLFERVVRLSRTLPDDAYTTALNVDDPGGLADLIVSTLPLSITNRQQILETIDPEERLHRVSALLTQELDLLELENRIQSQVQKEVDRGQRELFLREQLKVIQRELGQDEPGQRELASLRARLAATDLPASARARADEELGRLETIPPISPEYAVIRTYLDWLIHLPWGKLSDNPIDLRQAAAVLDAHHYGLSRVKDRILEFIAVRQLAGPQPRAPILCLVGPPGVGKTSLGRSIANAIGRPFVRLSLGGVRDEAEIRGHRRTYIGAMPGRIIQRMKEAATLDPVFMLDEVDKLGADFRGDPADALLEVLDPEQNHTFSDHYLDLPFDLSKIFFVTTANVADDIPEPLLDRMEVITLPGYTEDEKLAIAQKFLVPRQQDGSGLPDRPLRFGTTTLTSLIRHYTYEAGVRSLEREIGAICRKTARRIAEGRTYPRVVTPKLVNKLLGPPRHELSSIADHDLVGVALSMVYTGAGGDIMPIEVSLMEGKGVLTLTGQLGEVMQESAQAAMAYTRANATALGIDSRRFEKLDLHIHVPEGGTPKEGPSAGVTMAVALISALTGRPVRRDIAMTGELTLRGLVLPIGGVKEKLLGALRAGVTSVILPAKNRRELEEIPAKQRARLNINLVTTLDEILALVLGTAPPKEPARRNVAGRNKA